MNITLKGFSQDVVLSDMQKVQYFLVFDANGPETLARSYACLRPTGKLMVYGFHTLLPKQGGRIRYLKAGLGLLKLPRFNSLAMTTENKGVVAFNLSFLFDRTDLLQPLSRWLDPENYERLQLRANLVRCITDTPAGRAPATTTRFARRPSCRPTPARLEELPWNVSA